MHNSRGIRSVNRDSFLILLIGLLLGFITGYMMHEVMAARQPPRQVVGAPPVAQPQGQSGAGGSQAQGGGMAAMEEPKGTLCCSNSR